MKDRQKVLEALPVVERYVATVLAVVCALALRLLLTPVLADRAPYMFFLLTLVIATRIWGRGPGMLATLLGGVGSWYFLLEPRFSFSIASRLDAANLAAFFVVGMGISFWGAPSPRLVAAFPSKVGGVKLQLVRLTTVVAVAIVVLAGMVLLLLRDFERSQNADRWVAHTYEVINRGESLVTLVGSAESGARGFLLTGDAADLAPFTTAISTVPVELDRLARLTADNPGQRERCLAIGQLIDDRFKSVGRAVTLRKASQVDAAIAAFRSDDTGQTLGQLPSLMAELLGEERRSLSERTARAAVEDVRERWVLGLGSGLLIILLTSASLVFERESARREEIARALRRHAELLEQAHDSLLTCHLRGPVEYWSRGAEMLFGYTAKEAVGKPSHELLQTRHPNGVAWIDDVLERDGKWNGELIQTAKDGRQLNIDAQWRLAVDGEGNKLVLEANRDITAHRLAEAENLLLATAIEQAEETVVITDRFAKIQYANPAFTHTTGYSREEAVGQNPRVLKSGEHDAHFYRGLWAALSSGKLWRGEFTNRRKDGSLYDEAATIAPVRAASGEITNYIAIKSDITERKRGERALRESEKMLRLFVRHAPAAIAMLDAEMRYLVVSRRWMTDFHLGERDIRGLSHYDVFPEIPERWKEIHRRCLAGAIERCEEEPFPRIDGNIDWLRWEVRPWRRFDDSIGGIIIFSELITERRSAEEALKRNERLLRESQRAGRIGSYDLDVASGEWSSSTVMNEIFGIEKETVKNVESWIGLVHPRQQQEMAAYFQQIIREGSRFEKDYQIIRPSDGEERWVSGRGELILNEDLQPIRMVGTIQDITEQKRAAAALQESELRYRQLFERSESALAVYEMLYDEKGEASNFRYININPAFERVTGRVAANVLGRTAREVAPDIDDYWFELFDGVVKTGEPAMFEHFAAHLGRHFSGSVYSPRPDHVAVSFSDVTEHIRAEEEIRQLNTELEQRVRRRTADLESANHELEAFAHSVSHDLRAPLRGIDGWSLALVEDYGDRLDDVGHKYLGRVRSEAQRMGRLIDDLLHLSRLSRTELLPTTLDLSALVETLMGRLREAHPGRSIELVVEPRLECTADARLLEIALTNLLDNAVKFTGPREHARVEIGKTEVGGKSVVFVRDNGVGFDMSYAELLFAPFQRLHKASEFPGTGIGLATVQRVIHRHGGRIWAQSSVGEGTTFYFTLGTDSV